MKKNLVQKKSLHILAIVWRGEILFCQSKQPSRKDSLEDVPSTSTGENPKRLLFLIIRYTTREAMYGYLQIAHSNGMLRNSVILHIYMFSKIEVYKYMFMYAITYLLFIHISKQTNKVTPASLFQANMGPWGISWVFGLTESWK